VCFYGFIMSATFSGFSQPPLPLQILWLELFIDLSTSVAFEREPEEPDAMTRPPRPRDRPRLDSPLLTRITFAGGFSAVAALVVMLVHDGSPDHVRWLAYTTLVVAQIVRAYANRSLARPVLTLRPNGFLLAACLLVLAFQISIPFVPPLPGALRPNPLVAGHLATSGLG